MVTTKKDLGLKNKLDELGGSITSSTITK